MPHVKRLSKGKENIEPEIDSEPEVISEPEITSSEPVETSSEPVETGLSDIITLEEVPPEELESETNSVQLSILLADEAASEKARENEFESRLIERTNIPRPLGGPVTLLNDKYLLVNQITEGLCHPVVGKLHEILTWQKFENISNKNYV